MRLEGAPTLPKGFPYAHDYVQEIFGNQYSVIDNLERLPKKLPLLVRIQSVNATPKL